MRRTSAMVVLCGAVGLLGLVWPSSARAQGVHALGDPRPTAAQELDAPRRPGPTRTEGAAHDDRAGQAPLPGGPAGVGLKLGLGFIPAMSMRNLLGDDAGSARLGGRTGLQLALPITLGDAEGVRVNLEPYLFRYRRDTQGEDARGTALELGLYLGPSGQIRVRDAYVSIGVGLRAGYLRDDLVEYGGTLMGRLPVSVTYYVARRVGVTFEMAFAYGGTGMKSRVAPSNSELLDRLRREGVPPSSLDTAREASTGFLGHGFGMDSSLGVRFP